ncbi:MAG: DUF4388 domain-containing protein [Xenococcaceae cyanobacterium]
MSINTSFELFSLTDLFKVIASEQKSGRLTIKVCLEADRIDSKKTYYIWFQDGYFVAISDRLNHKGLINLIETRGWLSDSITSKLRTFCPINVPLGTYLKKSGLLSSEQVSLIFQMQLHQVFSLFEKTSGSFKFDEMSELKDRIMTIPWLEMTGNRLKSTEVSIYALRLIKDWSKFADRLPAPNTIFKSLSSHCDLKLMPLEKKFWQQVNGLNSINTIAKYLNKPVQAIQISAFRLLAIGLIEEIILPSLTLSTMNLNAATNKLDESNLLNTNTQSIGTEQVRVTSDSQDRVQKTNLGFQPEKEIIIADFPPRSIRDRQTIYKNMQSDAQSSFLDNILSLWRKQFSKP